VDLYLAALDAADLPDDQACREAVRKHIELGSQVVMHNSHAERDEDLYPLHEAPRWRWAGDGQAMNQTTSRALLLAPGFMMESTQM